MTNFLDYLKECKDCLYIYNLNYSIYGLSEQERYIVVVNDNWTCPEDWMGYDEYTFRIIVLSDWFKIVQDGHLIGWECACLNKKYIIKEHVKLLMTTNPLQLRKEIDTLKRSIYQESSLFDKWELIKSIKFSNQIIENHKIINFKEASKDFQRLKTEPLDDVIYEPYSRLKLLTDGILKQEIIKKINARSI